MIDNFYDKLAGTYNVSKDEMLEYIDSRINNRQNEIEILDAMLNEASKKIKEHYDYYQVTDAGDALAPMVDFYPATQMEDRIMMYSQHSQSDANYFSYLSNLTEEASREQKGRAELGITAELSPISPITKLKDEMDRVVLEDLNEFVELVRKRLRKVQWHFKIEYNDKELTEICENLKQKGYIDNLIEPKSFINTLREGGDYIIISPDLSKKQIYELAFNVLYKRRTFWNSKEVRIFANQYFKQIGKDFKIGKGDYNKNGYDEIRKCFDLKENQEEKNNH